MNQLHRYTVTAGVIVGDGPTVEWHLARGNIGKHAAKIEVLDRRGGRTSETAYLDLVPCDPCHPPCTTLSVNCPTTTAQGEVAEVEAIVSGVDRLPPLTYLWSHSHGRRLPSQSGPRLKIEAIGLPGEVITATVRVRGRDPRVITKPLAKLASRSDSLIHRLGLRH